MKSRISEGIWSIGDNKAAVIFNAVKGMPQHSQPKQVKSNGDSDVCVWGDNNLYPIEFERKLKKSGTAIGGLEVLTSAHYGTGFSLFEEIDTDSGTDFKKVRLTKYPEIHEFFRRTKYNLFNLGIIKDFESYRWTTPEFLLSPDFSKIISVKRQPVAKSRFQVPNEQSGLIDNIIVNNNWESRKKENDILIPAFDQMFSVEEIKEECKRRKIHNFTIPAMDVLSIENVYPSVGWHSSFKNGWMDVVLAIPEFKKFMFENQLNFKYLIHLADDYFAHIYQDAWIDFTDEEKESKRKELVDKIDSKIAGNKGAGTSIISPFFRDKNSGELIKGVQIETIKQDQSNGDFLVDASAGNSEILFPMGVDPCLLGAGIPGGKNLSGSGSDKREAYTILCSRLPAKHAVTLEIFLTIRDWNGWDPNLIGKFPNIQLTTLDKNPTGQTSVPL
ncbi:hypothetical protein [Chryseobacterium sp. MEBOG07]|uniref:hypothetical protein n=1 Tax=Chryseobacterium sp. MEBOG07 TaxID=2879939 RepID=UPI001F1E1C30|nr:hypothetical protein [Chryseobacterium sp. MEBOG07]UKB81258.1 hypothetical protein LF886_09785 [Chryseobacterium sp. MEBOG07]